MPLLPNVFCFAYSPLPLCVLDSKSLYVLILIINSIMFRSNDQSNTGNNRIALSDAALYTYEEAA